MDPKEEPRPTILPRPSQNKNERPDHPNLHDTNTDTSASAKIHPDGDPGDGDADRDTPDTGARESEPHPPPPDTDPAVGIGIHEDDLPCSPLTMFKYFVISSIVMDVILLVVSLIVVPSYEALAPETYMDNGVNRSTADFIAARERADYPNTPKAKGPTGITIAYTAAGVSGLCLFIDVFAALLVVCRGKARARTPTSPSTLDEPGCRCALRGWVLTTLLHSAAAVPQMVILGQIISAPRPEDRGKRRSTEYSDGDPTIRPQNVYLFPANLDYSLDHDAWEKAAERLKTNLIVTFAFSVTVLLFHPMLLFVCTDLTCKAIRSLLPKQCANPDPAPNFESDGLVHE